MTSAPSSPLQQIKASFQQMDSEGREQIRGILEMEAQGQKRMDEIPDDILIPLLVQRSAHLPGNSWWQDWFAFMRNNHVFFGICFHHKKHPIETWERWIVVLGSVAFGLCATNIGYLYDWYTGEENLFDPSGVAFTWTIKSVMNESGYQTLVVTKHMLLRQICGSIMHSLFDYFVWNISACACCHPGGRYAKSEHAKNTKDIGSIVLIPIVGFLLAVGLYSSYRRAHNLNDYLEDQYGDDRFDDRESILWDYFFLADFEFDLLMTWFFFSPLIATIIFSGILGCNGRLPVLGGRPYDLKMVEEMLQEYANVDVTKEDENSRIDFAFFKL